MKKSNKLKHYNGRAGQKWLGNRFNSVLTVYSTYIILHCIIIMYCLLASNSKLSNIASDTHIFCIGIGYEVRGLSV